jgi:hypothetical protein
MPIEDLGVLSGVIQALIFFSFLGAIILVPRYLSYKNRAKLHETLRAAIEKGQPMPPELIDALRGGGGGDDNRPTGPDTDLRRGAVMVGAGLGIMLLGAGLYFGFMYVNPIPAGIIGGSVAGGGAIPTLIGVAYLILWAGRHGASKP